MRIKPYLCAAGVFALLLLTVPALSMIKDGKPVDIPEEPAVTEEKSEKKTDKTDIKTEMLKVFDTTTGQVEEISSFDYVVGAVCAQMPAAFEEEALKAQAVAAYTYAVRQREKAKTAPDKELCGAYFSNDSRKYQAYFTENQQKHYYGDNYDMFIEKIKKAVEAVGGEYLTYKDEPIIAAFHPLSSGKTESAKNVWGSDIPYLVSVDSKYDTSAPKYEQQYEFTAAELKRTLEKSFGGVKLDKDTPEKWFGEPKKSEAETVLSINVGGKDLTGQEIRTALELGSAAFDVEYDDGDFVFTTKGCGHGVGMSQFGANELAKSGKNYKEILEYYYTGAKITGNEK